MRDISSDLSDLGFGERALQDTTHRILNRDGSFNVRREGRSFWQSVNPYHLLLSVSWTRFNLMLVGLYLTITGTFAVAFVALGPRAIGGSTASTGAAWFAEAFYFSVQTVTTVGYGHLVPTGTAANLLVTLEAAVGMSGIAVAAALIFARVSAPSARILFSETAIVDRDLANPVFKFRLANGARSELVDATARVILAKTEQRYGIRTRRFHELALERDRIAFFPLDWTVVHRIDAQSPLHNMAAEDFEGAKVEFLILINSIDDGASQAVHARSSYLWDELTWDKRFVDMYRKQSDGRMSVDLRLLHDTEDKMSRTETNETIWDT